MNLWRNSKYLGPAKGSADEDTLLPSLITKFLPGTYSAERDPTRKRSPECPQVPLHCTCVWAHTHTNTHTGGGYKCSQNTYTIKVVLYIFKYLFKKLISPVWKVQTGTSTLLVRFLGTPPALAYPLNLFSLASYRLWLQDSRAMLEVLTSYPACANSLMRVFKAFMLKSNTLEVSIICEVLIFSSRRQSILSLNFFSDKKIIFR